jgi:hypothetical protein
VSRKSRLTALGICCADHATPSIRKRWHLTLPTCRGRSVGIVLLRSKATEISLVSEFIRQVRMSFENCAVLYSDAIRFISGLKMLPFYLKYCPGSPNMQIETFHVSNTFDVNVLICSFPYIMDMLVHTLAYRATFVPLFVTSCRYFYCDSLSLSAHRS